MSQKTIKIDDLFEKAGAVIKRIFVNRFTVYKTVGVLVAVVFLSSMGFWAWNHFKIGESEAQAGWYNDNWTRRYKLTINEAYTQGDLVDFPVLISTTTTDIKNYARADGRDIIFTDNTGTKLNREIEKYDATTGELVAWVKAPTVASSTDTILYMYYGNSGYSEATSTGADLVWDSSYKGVWHLPNNAGNAKGDFNASTTDSTVNNNDGAAVGNSATTASGNIDGAFSFDGDGDYINAGDSSDYNFGSGDFTIELWANPTLLANSKHFITKRGGNANVKWILVQQFDNSTYRTYISSDGSTWDIARNALGNNNWGSATAGSWTHLVMSRVGSSIYLYNNASLISSINVGSSSISNDTSALLIGADSDAYSVNGLIDEVRISQGVGRSQGWILTSYNNQNSPGTFLTWNAIESGGGPVAYWSFDEGYASTTYDRVGTNNGTLQSNTQWVDGKYGKALSFDGVDDYVSISSAPDLSKMNQFTITSWSYFGKTHGGSNAGAIFYQDQGGGYYFGLDYENYYYHFRMKADGAWYDYYSHQESPSIMFKENQWNHLVVVNNGTKIGMYVNEEFIGWDSASFTTVNSTTGTSAIGVTNNYFKGLIDEVKIYNRALDYKEVAALYSAGGSASGQGASVSVGKSFVNKYGDPGTVTDGLVGYWKFDETSAWGATAGAVKDSSGLNNNGTSTSATTTTDQAKYGRSAGLGAVGYIDILGGSGTSLDTKNAITISAWIRHRSAETAGPIFEYGDGTNVGAQLWVYDTNTSLAVNLVETNGTGHYHTISGVITPDTWQQAVVAYDNTTGYEKVYVNGVMVYSNYLGHITLQTSYSRVSIGYRFPGGDSFNGYIDDVKIYNRALSADEVTREYVSGPGPVGYWRFEEKTGTTAYDLSGNFNNGTLTNGPTYDAGKVGGALRFDGTNDYVNLTNSYQIGYLTVEAWIKPSEGVFSAGRFISSDYDSVGTDLSWQLAGVSGAQTYRLRTDTAGGLETTDTSSFNMANVWYHLTGTYDGTYNKIFVNGVLNISEAHTYGGAIKETGNTRAIGMMGNTNSYYWSGLIDEVKIYNYARSQRQIMQDYNGGGPIGYWKFDEGYASTTYDGSGNGNNGTLQENTLWTMNGKFGKALSFDGVNDYVSVSNAAANNFSNQSFTTGLWFKASSQGTGAGHYNYLLSKANYDYMLYTGNNSLLFYLWDLHGTGGCALDSLPSYNLGTSYVGNWNQAVGVLDWESGKVKIYYNGALASQKSFTPSACTLSTTGTLNFGTSGDGVSGWFPGSIDDVKIYNYARTAEEIRQDYNAGGSASGKGASMVLGSQKNSASTWNDGGFGGAAPVGYWRFEEKTGTTAYDASGNSNTGTLTNGPTYDLGKVGGALRFDGTDDYVNVADSDVLDQTTGLSASAWFRPTTYGGKIVSKFVPASANGSWYISMLNSTNQLYITLSSNGSQTYYAYGGSAISYNTWHHVEMVYNGGTPSVSTFLDGQSYTFVTTGGSIPSSLYVGTNPVMIGAAQDSRYFSGLIDEAKIYNYARTQAQIAFDYNGGKPIAQWKFDEGQGGTAYDASGNGNNGTIYPGTGGTNTSTSTMWSNGINGKINKALSFDGTDDYVNIPNSNSLNITGDLTIGTWVKTTSNTSGLVDFGDQGGSGGYLLMIGSGEISAGKLSFFTTSGGWDGSTTAINDNQWHYATVSLSGTTVSFYIDGKLDSTAVSAAPATWTAPWLAIGSNSYGTSAYLSGLIDDVRIYNYARTAEQVMQDYNNGAGARF